MTTSVLVEMVDAIVREIQPERIYLFGSRARGDARADSDVDLLIVERGAFGPGHSRSAEIDRISQVIAPFRVRADVLVHSMEEVQHRRRARNHVIARCLREGRVLYESPTLGASGRSDPHAGEDDRMSDMGHARMLLIMARKHLRALEILLAAGDVDPETAGFHAQQAVEKALKAWLSLAQVLYPRTHDIAELATLLAEHGHTVPHAFLALQRLTKFAVLFRYEPIPLDEADTNQAQLTQQVAALVEHVDRLVRAAG